MLLARSFDVLHQVDAIARQRPVNALQDVQRLTLIVHGIERGDEGERLGRGHPVEVAEIGYHKLDILQRLGRSLVARGSQGFLRKVHSHKVALRKEFGHPV